MTTNARLHVDPPTFVSSPYGLLSVADIRTEPDPHWQAGVSWEDICGGSGTTVDYCITSATVVTGAGSVPAKAATTGRTLYGATPFTVYVEVDCSPIDFMENRDRIMTNALARYESFQVERTFWTGTALDRNNQNGLANAVLPHLAANSAVNEVSLGRTTVLQMAATTVTGTALNVVDALGALEGALAACLNGTGIIHVPQALAPTIALLLKQQGGRLVTPNGNNVAIGAGYPGTSPTGAAPPLGTSWMYATGPVFAYRGVAKMYAAPNQSLDRNVNTVKAIIERTYVLGFDCCLFAQPVNTSSFFATSTSTP